MLEGVNCHLDQVQRPGEEEQKTQKFCTCLFVCLTSTLRAPGLYVHLGVCHHAFKDGMEALMETLALGWQIVMRSLPDSWKLNIHSGQEATFMS